MKTRFLLAPVVMAVLMLTLGAGSASAADLADFDLTVTNLNGFTGPYVHVAFSNFTAGAGGSVTITFTSLTVGGVKYWMIGGNGKTMALNVSSGFSSVTSVAGFAQSPVFQPTACSGANETLLNNACVNTSTGQVGLDGFGSFNLTIQNVDGTGSAVDSISVTLSGNWATTLAVLSTAGLSGATNKAAAHINPNRTNNCTGFAGTSSTSPGSPTAPREGDCVNLPEPNSLVLLLASGIAGVLGVFVRRMIV